MSPTKRSVTLMELVIALVIFGLLVLTFTSIDLFSRYHVIGADRRAKIQNEVSSAVEHMTKHISRGIGTVANLPVVVHFTSQRVKVRTDQNLNGIIDDNLATCFICYRYDTANRRILFYPQYPSGNTWPTALANQQIAAQIVACTFTYNSANDFVTVDVRACWNPLSPATCGTPDNPDVRIRTNIKMPAVALR